MSGLAHIKNYLNTGVDVDKARADGYVILGPMERQIAIEFAISGNTLKQIADTMGQPLGEVKRAFNSPVVRAFIKDLQDEVSKHKIINAAWVEQQLLDLWPKLIGEEEVAIVGRDGEQYERKKFHSAEVTSILKHFGGNDDQKKAGGVKVVINFGEMGVSPSVRPVIEVEPSEG